MGMVCDVLTHLAIGVGNVLGVAIRLGHGEVDPSGPRPRVKIAAPVHGIPDSLRRPVTSEILAVAAQLRGIRGVVIDGVREAAERPERDRHQQATHSGRFDDPNSVGGATIRRGDLVVGDEPRGSKVLCRVSRRVLSWGVYMRSA